MSAPKIWNSLPIFIRNLETTSKAEFKTALDSYLRDIPDIPRLGYSTWAKKSLVDILGFKKPHCLSTGRMDTFGVEKISNK